MRAAAVRRFKGPVELLELPEPSPRPGELRVTLRAAGMNPFDWKIADGALSPGRPHVFPLVLGVDGAGVVSATGDGTPRFRLGDRVVGSFLHDPVGIGTYAESAVVPASNCVVALDGGFDLSVAAALPTAGMAALQSVDLLGVPSGGRVVLVGAAGGVGSFALQLARSRGWRVVAVARPAAHERLRALGAAETIAPEDGQALGGALEGLIDLVSDRNGFAQWARRLRPGSVAVSSVGAATPVEGLRTVSLDMQPNVADLERLVSAVREGTLTVPVARRIRLDDAPAAVEESRAGRSVGKTVIGL